MLCLRRCAIWTDVPTRWWGGLEIESAVCATQGHRVTDREEGGGNAFCFG
jgi:hypothetical protein